MRRRSLLLASLAAAPLAARAQSRGPRAAPLRLGADLALVDSGLAHALQQAFGRDTGIGVQVIRGPALALLDSLAAGELDAGLTNAPAVEAGLEQQGLVYDRRLIALGEFMLVGPGAHAKTRNPAGTAGNHSVAAALTRLRDTASASASASAYACACKQ